MLHCDGLVKDYGGLRALDAVSFEVRAGEIYGLLGPNGAGKTTALRLAAGLLPADGGRVFIAGRARRRRDPEACALMGVMPQETALYEELTGRENVCLFGRLYGLSGRELARRSATVLARVGLAAQAGRPAGAYSVGMRRRLSLAVAVVHGPRLLLADEPTAGVDPQGRAGLIELVGELAAGGAAVLYTTHYLEEAERLCHRVGILDRGRLLAEGRPEELARSAAGPRRLLVAGEVTAEQARSAAAGLPGAGLAGWDSSGAATFLLPPEAGAAGRLLAALVASGARIDAAETSRPGLNELFLGLTGRELRD